MQIFSDRSTLGLGLCHTSGTFAPSDGSVDHLALSILGAQRQETTNDNHASRRVSVAMSDLFWNDADDKGRPHYQDVSFLPLRWVI